MKDLKLSNMELDDSFPYEMIRSIARIMYTVFAANDSICLAFDTKRVSPLFSIPIMAMSDKLHENGHALSFRASDLSKNPAMQRFFLDSGILDNMNPSSGKKAKEAIQQASNKSLTEATSVTSHRINLDELRKSSLAQQQKRLIKEGRSVLSPLIPVVATEDLIGLLCKLIELFDNALFHSDSKHWAYSTAVQLRNGECLVAVYDQGIGIPGAYKKYRELYKDKLNLSPLDDQKAIWWAMQKGTSTLQCQEGYSRGVGLNSMKDFVDRYNGMISVASGEGYYSYRDSNEQTYALDFPLQGTLFMMKLSTANRTQRLKGDYE